MKKNKKSKIILILVVFSIFISNTSFAENSASFSVSCRVPDFATLANGEKALSGTQVAVQKPEEDQKSIIGESNEDLIELKEEVDSKDTNDKILIVTVCAK